MKSTSEPTAIARAGCFKQAGVTLQEGSALTGQTEQTCEGNRVFLLATSGHSKQAEVMLDNLVRDIKSGNHPVGEYIPSLIASL